MYSAGKTHNLVEKKKKKWKLYTLFKFFKVNLLFLIVICQLSYYPMLQQYFPILNPPKLLLNHFIYLTIFCLNQMKRILYINTL